MGNISPKLQRPEIIHIGSAFSFFVPPVALWPLWQRCDRCCLRRHGRMVWTAVGKIPWPESLNGWWSYLGLILVWVWKESESHKNPVMCKNDMSQFWLLTFCKVESHSTKLLILLSQATACHGNRLVHSTNPSVAAAKMQFLRNCLVPPVSWLKTMSALGSRSSHQIKLRKRILRPQNLLHHHHHHHHQQQQITHKSNIFFSENGSRKFFQVSKSRTLPSSWPGNNVVKESNAHSPANSVACHEQSLIFFFGACDVDLFDASFKKKPYKSYANHMPKNIFGRFLFLRLRVLWRKTSDGPMFKSLEQFDDWTALITDPLRRPLRTGFHFFQHPKRQTLLKTVRVILSSGLASSQHVHGVTIEFVVHHTSGVKIVSFSPFHYLQGPFWIMIHATCETTSHLNKFISAEVRIPQQRLLAVYLGVTNGDRVASIKHAATWVTPWVEIRLQFTSSCQSQICQNHSVLGFFFFFCSFKKTNLRNTKRIPIYMRCWCSSM